MKKFRRGTMLGMSFLGKRKKCRAIIFLISTFSITMVTSDEVIGAGSQTVIEGEKHSTGVMNLPADSSATFSIDFDDKHLENVSESGRLRGTSSTNGLEVGKKSTAYSPVKNLDLMSRTSGEISSNLVGRNEETIKDAAQEERKLQLGSSSDGKSPLDDFYFHPRQDSLGGDLGKMNGTNNELAIACRKHPECFGFNTEGWLKKSIHDYSDWYIWTDNVTKGFYTKKSCYDLDSIDRQWPCSERASLNMCFSDQSWMNIDCKKTCGTCSVNDQKSILNIVITTPKIEESFNFIPLKDSPGGDLFVQRLIGSLHFIAEVCRKNSKCVGFNSNGWLKEELMEDRSLWHTWTQDSSKGFYVKKDCIDRDLYDSCAERRNRDECNTNRDFMNKDCQKTCSWCLSTDTPVMDPSTSPATKSPTKVPTVAPLCSLPIISPTENPTEDSSMIPSTNPTIYLSESPSISHSDLPTNTTTIPSKVPSDGPTILPTDVLSTSPSRFPSPIPSSVPTKVPSASPSDEPSQTPSDGPTAIPTHVPSTLPSRLPSVIPSSIPSHLPSASPTEKPSQTPSDGPTAIPTDVPSTSLSRPPSVIPSSVPSKVPSESPSDEPLQTLSGSPTVSPTHVPSSPPSRLPSVIPSSIPSKVPSESPSDEPSQTPSNGPTAIPTCVPSSSPSRLPSVIPSSIPSKVPSESPSEEPSQTPSGSLTVSPTHVPSSSPSRLPSAIPSSIPSKAPSESPSDEPSQTPSGSLTVSPTHVPSSSPSRIPSVIPSSISSEVPSESSTNWNIDDSMLRLRNGTFSRGDFESFFNDALLPQIYTNYQGFFGHVSGASERLERWIFDDDPLERDDLSQLLSVYLPHLSRRTSQSTTESTVDRHGEIMLDIKGQKQDHSMRQNLIHGRRGRKEEMQDANFLSKMAQASSREIINISDTTEVRNMYEWDDPECQNLIFQIHVEIFVLLFSSIGLKNLSTIRSIMTELIPEGKQREIILKAFRETQGTSFDFEFCKSIVISFLTIINWADVKKVFLDLSLGEWLEFSGGLVISLGAVIASKGTALVLHVANIVQQASSLFAKINRLSGLDCFGRYGGELFYDGTYIFDLPGSKGEINLRVTFVHEWWWGNPEPNSEEFVTNVKNVRVFHDGKVIATIVPPDDAVRGRFDTSRTVYKTVQVNGKDNQIFIQVDPPMPSELTEESDVAGVWSDNYARYTYRFGLSEADFETDIHWHDDGTCTRSRQPPDSRFCPCCPWTPIRGSPRIRLAIEGDTDANWSDSWSWPWQ